MQGKAKLEREVEDDVDETRVQEYVGKQAPWLRPRVFSCFDVLFYVRGKVSVKVGNVTVQNLICVLGTHEVHGVLPGAQARVNVYRGQSTEAELSNKHTYLNYGEGEGSGLKHLAPCCLSVRGATGRHQAWAAAQAKNSKAFGASARGARLNLL